MGALSQQLPLRDIELRMPQAFIVSWKSRLQYWVSSTHRRNTSVMEVLMDVKKRKARQSVRAKLRSPGRPPVLHRAARWPFWQAIARGLSSEDAAALAGVSPAVGNRWFRQCEIGRAHV